MLKRQDSLLSSSSRHETPPLPDHQRHHTAKSTGCMSAIFHLLYKYQNRRKFLTSGKRQEKRDTNKKHRQKQESRDVGRSPTIPSDIRRLTTSLNSPENSRSPPGLVPRLMGLVNEVPAAGSMEHYYSSSTTMNGTSLERRRKLMSDINNCNQDLQELKKSIQAIQFATRIGRSLLLHAESEGEDDDNVNNILKDDQPSPVSVLDREFARSPLISSSGYTTRQTAHGRIQLPQAPKATSGTKQGEDDTSDWLFFQMVTVKSLLAKREAAGYSPPWTTKAMANSVEEVCEDIDLGGKNEVAKIGELIHEYICKDLIEEVVKDMGLCCTNYSLPFHACKRRLCF